MTNPPQLTDAETEAIRTLKSLIDLSAEELDVKQRAAAALVNEVAALHDLVGFVVKAQQHYTALLFSQTKSAIFRVAKEGDIVLTTADKIGIPLAIEYDRALRKWVGTELDTNIAPIPGLPYRRKEPLVALAEAVVKAINTPITRSVSPPTPRNNS